MRESNYWQGKTVLVTGGSAGLGLQLARMAAQSGARVAIIARDADRLHQAATSLQRDDTIALPADITQQSDVDRAFSTLREQSVSLDALINCAGRSHRGLLMDTPVETFRELLELNFLAMVRCTRAALPMLLDSRGHVVNIGSLASKSAAPYLGAYPASKFPVAAYSQQLRLELADRGVHTLLVCPGPLERNDAGTRYADANVPAESQKPGGGVKLKGIDPEQLARRILRACEQRKAELVVPGKAKLLFTIAQISARWGDAILKLSMSSR